jgi:hypothetical protein
VENYCEKYKNELKENLLSRKNWKKLSIIKNFLTLFSRAILITEEDGISIDFTFFNIDILIQHL